MERGGEGGDGVKDGGPAFPHKYVDDGYDYFHRGMSLRDWFAGQALRGILSNRDLLDRIENCAESEGTDLMTETAIWAYDYADEMLAQKEQKQ